MKKYIFVFLSVCSVFATISAQGAVKPSVVVAEGTTSSVVAEGTITTETEMQCAFEVTQGWRREVFHHKNSSKGVHIKGQKAHLKNVYAYETRIRLEAGVKDCAFVRLDGGYGMLLNSTTTFSALGVKGNLDSTKGVTGGYEWDGKATIGGEYTFHGYKGFFNETASIYPLFGYIGGLEKVHFKKSKHQTFFWNLPFIGLAFKKEFDNRWFVYAEYDFAYIPWVENKSYGSVGLLSAGYNITKDIALKAEYEYSYLNGIHHKKTSRTASTVRLALAFAF